MGGGWCVLGMNAGCACRGAGAGEAGSAYGGASHGSPSHPLPVSVLPHPFCVLCVSGRRQSFRTASAPARQATLERLAALQQLLGEPALSQPGPTQLPHRQQALCGIQALLEDCQAMWDGDSE